MAKSTRAPRSDSKYEEVLQLLRAMPAEGATLEELDASSPMLRSTIARHLRAAKAKKAILVGKRTKPPGQVGRCKQTYAIKPEAAAE